MNRLIKHFATGSVVLALSGIVACTTANTAPPHVDPTPTPAPTPKFSNENYAAALRTASVKLRGKLPDTIDLQDVLGVTPGVAGGQATYEAVIDRYLDIAQNPLLGGQLRQFYQSVFLMGTTVTVNGMPYNEDEPSNLAVYAILNDKPVSELLTADYCVNNNFAIYPAATAVDGSTADNLGCAMDGAPADQRAGIISQKTFLTKYGTATTVNMRRMSVIHQIFNCGIYPDSQDVPLFRTNDTTQDAFDATNTNPACSAVGCPDNGMPGSDGVIANCTGSTMYPCNNNDTASDPTDDFADPSLGLVAHDPATPNIRISKKYQSKLKGAVGQECHDCHGSLNARRPVMIPYDEFGVYDMTRTTQSVESPDVNGNKDYCGIAPDHYDPATMTRVAGADATDDIDPQSADCQNGATPTAVYFGNQTPTLKAYGAAIIAQPRFYSCMTARHYDFVLGKTQGLLGLQAAGGAPPATLDPSIQSKYQLIYEASGWNTLTLLRAVFKGDEFLTAQM